MPSNYDYIPGAQGTRNSLQGGSSITSAGRPVSQPYGNRYIPPTFNFGRDPGGGRPNYDQMDWNNIQGYNLPQQGNNPYQQEYMGGLRDMLGSFQGRYPQQQPRMPQFSGGDPYNMYDAFTGGGGVAPRGGQDFYNNMLQSQRGPQNIADQYSGDMSQFEGPMYDPGGQGGYGTGEQRQGPYQAQLQAMLSRMGGGQEGGGGMSYSGGTPGFYDDPRHGGYGGGGGLSRFGGGQTGNYGGRGGFDPRALMAQLFGGMSPEQMFSGGNFGQQQRPRPKYPDFNSGYGTGGAGPESGMVTKPLQMGGGG